ncbi:MAG: hypothetical protein LRZ85_05775 [Alphaproteobacteria bacterium]|nr:hypothetical protein [Alphaproteobacteria bacterium]MCD8520124.1 hypothetical protein [Alphaproteobacteria bacterium]MCD8525942.1 hypothetical protein [Alphaproteobacteria bacterium]MCD8571087.1 hypothetical protein [Alphaproteobacteria bacterium]
MISAAQAYDIPSGDSLFRHISGGFEQARGRLFDPLDETTQSKRGSSAAASTETEGLETLDLAPPDKEAHELARIQKLLNNGDIERAAERLQYVIENYQDFDFSAGQTEQLLDLGRQTRSMIAENETPDWSDTQRDMMLEWLDNLLSNNPEAKPAPFLGPRSKKDDSEPEIIDAILKIDGIGFALALL